MCLQHILCAQALVDRHLTLGVLCGVKQMYHPHELPPCVHGEHVDWTRGSSEEAALAPA